MRVQRTAPITGSQLVHDYYSGDVSMFTAAWDMPGIRKHCGKVNKSSRHRELLAQCLTEFNQQLGAKSRTIANAKRLASKDCLAVVTGQQTGLLGGPALAVYKAMTAVVMAQRLERELKRPVVPVFWMASEDHDFYEVNRLYIISAKKKKQLFTLGNIAPGRRPVGRMDGLDISGLLQRLKVSVAATDYNVHLLEEIQACNESDGNLCRWFARLMLMLLKDKGLVMLDPMLPELRRLAAPLLRQAVEQNELVQEAVTAGGLRLQECGYMPALNGEQGQMHLFSLAKDQRLPLYLKGNRISTRDNLSNWEVKRSELAGMVDTVPELFSPGVALRPVVQDYLLPTALFVAGPGEINYLAQLKEVYRVAAVPMPPVFPRAQLTLIGEAEERVLNTLGVNAESVMTNGSLRDAFEYYVRRHAPVPVQDWFAQQRGEMETVYRELVSRLHSLDPKFETLAQSGWQKIGGQLNYLEQKAWQSIRHKHRGLWGQTVSAETVLYPSGIAQEQVFSFFSLLFHFGEAAERILHEVDFGDSSCHQLVFL